MMFLTACKPDATQRAKDSATLLTGFYQQHTIRGDWGVFAVTAKDKSVAVAINIPDTQADQLKAMPVEERLQFIAHNACPPTEEVVWSHLEPDGDIVVQARQKGVVFEQVSCKTARETSF